MKVLPFSLSLVAIGLTVANTAFAAHSAGDQMSQAADRLVAALNDEQKAKAIFPFKDDERQNWHFIPKARKGLPLKEMTSAQRDLALQFFRAGMSERGYAKATNIISLELILRELERGNPRMVRDPELYYFSIFGKPGPTNTWAWRVEGHHLSANFTIIKGEWFSGTPSFFGTNPAEVRAGDRKGLRILAAEEDLARELLASLNSDQKKLVLIETEAPKDILTEARKKVASLGDAGLPAEKMTAAQRELLFKLTREYVNRLRPELAATDWKKIETAGVEKIVFAWAGGMQTGQPYYYRVQGPTFLLELDNTQNEANHIHAVWRDFAGDFGEDLLQKHYQESPHASGIRRP